ncbi:MAG: 5-formyltetrahydrofolate cyclo-ligase [Actinobacteria bacterium]|nr:5-formyltetrahydrofolate cyclo-ligase [Actinomycetota bacterium]
MEPGGKTALRSAILAARRAVPQRSRDIEAAALRKHASMLARSGQTVCAYVPVGTEPGSLTLVDALLESGARVLLPIARHDETGRPQPLSWADYRPGSLVTAPFGLREPTPPWLPPGALAAAALVLVPALAVDRRGTRLGRGAGFYDRTLGLADPAAALVTVVRDDELVDHLPAEPHDVPMTHALTPTAGLLPLTGERPGE